MIDIDKVCKKYGIAAKKSLGQNFLKNSFVLDKIIEVGDVNEGDAILEIGPGLGVLTELLVKNAENVLCVELDDRLIPILEGEFLEYENFSLWHQNILDVPNSEISEKLGGKYKVIANIPYNITSPILRKFTEQEPIPELCVFMVQKEVAQRVKAKPGGMSVLAVAVQFYAEVEYIQTVPAADFEPAPKVDSAIIRLKPHEKFKKLLELSEISEKQFFSIVKIGFSARRKQLHNTLGAGLRLKNEKIKAVLEELSLSENVRAQELKIEDWIHLVKRLHELYDVI